MRLPVVKEAVKQELEPTGIHPTAMEGTSPETAWFGVYRDDEGREQGFGNVLKANIVSKEKVTNFAIFSRGIGS